MNTIFNILIILSLALLIIFIPWVITDRRKETKIITKMRDDNLLTAKRAAEMSAVVADKQTTEEVKEILQSIEYLCSQGKCTFYIMKPIDKDVARKLKRQGFKISTQNTGITTGFTYTMTIIQW